MLGVILTGHGSFATGLYEAAVQIMGEQIQFTAVNFPDGMSSEQLEHQLIDALTVCDKGDGVVFLTDILGGSPFRFAAMLSYQYPHIEVISGTNMPLLLEMLMQRDAIDSASFRLLAIDNGKQGVTSLWHENQKSPATNKECQDGI